MSGQNRYMVPPTVTMLAVMKARLQGATKGHSLLKKKADALTIRFRQILSTIIETKQQMGQSMRDSSFKLTEAKYAAGEKVKHTILDNVESAKVKVAKTQDNIAGVKIPKYECVREEGESKMDLTGLGAGGQQIQNARRSYLEAIELLVELASLQTAFITLDVAIKVTNRRVNALENVVKPKVANTIAYIKGELDELEREDFFRLKKVQAKKKRDAEAAQEVLKEQSDERVAGQDAGNLLDAHDEDIVF